MNTKHSITRNNEFQDRFASALLHCHKTNKSGSHYQRTQAILVTSRRGALILCIQSTFLVNCEDHLHYCQNVFSLLKKIKLFSLARCFSLNFF